MPCRLTPQCLMSSCPRECRILAIQHIVRHQLHHGHKAERTCCPPRDLPLTARDEQDLDAIRGALEFGSAVAAALGLDLNAAGDFTESVLLHVVFTGGLQSLLEETEEDAYDRLAKEQQATAARRRAEARRWEPSWADEE